MYSLSFVDIAVSATQDIWEIATAATTSLVLHGLIIGQSSDYGDAAAEGLRLSIRRGAASGSGGTTGLTPVALAPGGSSSSSTCERNNTTAGTGGTEMVADCFNIQAGYQLWFTPECRPIIAPSSRLTINITAPTDAVTMSSTLFWEEV